MPVRSSTVPELCRWKDLQLQVLGTDLQTRVLEASSGVSDPFQEVGWRAGIQIWRITKNRAVHWPIELYGHFWEEDIYLILHTGTGRTSSGTPLYNMHLWCGKGASQDDFAAGAYKVAELDEKTQYGAAVHREIQGRETEDFLEYFFPYTTLWRGSSDNNHFCTRGDSYQAKLLRWYRPDRRVNAIRVKEVPPNKGSLSSEHIMLLDLGQQIYQWIGRDANTDEILLANRYVEEINANRGGSIKVEVINEGVSPDHYFYFYLQDGSGVQGGLVDSDDETAERVSRNVATLSRFKPILSQVNVQHGKTEFKVVREGKVEEKDYKGRAVCIFDSGFHCFVCFDQAVKPEMKNLGLQHGHEYLRTTNHPLIPLTVLKKGHVLGDVDNAPTQ